MASADSKKGRLAGRIIVITGASSGIGRATAETFIAEGARVVLLDRDGAGAEKTLGSAEGMALAVDITDENAVADALGKAEAALGGLDGVVNSAGIMLTGPITEMSFDTWRKTIDVNLTGSFNVVKCALPALQRQSGATIVNIASAAGLLPNAPGLVAYAASKGGVISMTRALASDLAPAIRVNCVCPGMVETPMSEGVRANVGNYALKRMAKPEEIANVILFLTSAESSYVTGAVVAADGGRSFH